MSEQYFMDAALLAQGWARSVLVTLDADGMIRDIATGMPATVATAAGTAAAGAPLVPADAERIAGIVVPGMSNGHSHAFQRGMAGSAEYRLSARDSFWTWRQAMYALAGRIEPDDLELLATQLFIEMLKSGYTSVAEFHYLHRRPDGAHYEQGRGLWDAVTAAAVSAGIALTLLPTLYQTSDFGGQSLTREQARFALDTDWFVRAIADRLDAERHAPSLNRTGAAFHSLRAVPLQTVRETSAALRALSPALPLHIHVAEQVKEVQACMKHTGRRPLELLLDSGLLDEHWCLVHATHATQDELRGVAEAAAAVCVSISTEANLGDGFFETDRFLQAGGRICIGSDSQATVSPAEELRWMEYQLRLRKKRRGVLAGLGESHVGTRLWSDAARHGAQAIGQPTGSIEIGQRADWLVLDPAHASMAGAALDTALDHVVFAGGCAAIRDVMVGGRWTVRDGNHALEAGLRGRFTGLMQRLAPH